jgi:HEAT repeat protein
MPDRERALGLLGRLVEGDPEAEVRARAAIAMADCEAGPGQIDVLISAARGEHIGVAEMALAALREICPPGERRVTRLLENLVQSKHAAVRFQVVAAGSRLLGDSAFDKLLTTAFVDSDPKVRALAFRVCEERFDVELPPFVQKASLTALADGDRSVRLAAAILMAPLGNEKARAVLVAALNQRWAIAAPEDEQTVVELAGELSLHDALPGLRRHARGWLGLVPGRFAWQAQVAMASLGDAHAQKAIGVGLRSNQSHVRAAAALAVGRARLHGLRDEVEALGNAGKLPADVFEQVIADLATSRA